jgi:glycosyltransferase involved in cell wall biosynthesis
MRILMISDVYFPRVNGVSTSIQTFAHQLIALGHDVLLVVPDYERDQADDTFEIIRVPGWSLPFDPEDRLMYWRPLCKQLQRLSTYAIDLVHIQTPFIAHYAGVRFARRYQLPIVESYHTFFEQYADKYFPWLPSRWIQALTRQFSRSQCQAVDELIVPSYAMREVLQHYGITTPTTVIPTGIDLEALRPGDGQRFRQRFHIPPERPVLLYVGRLGLEKNIEFLLRMLSYLQPRCPDILLIIAGEGPARATLETRTRQLGLTKQVQFIGYLTRQGALEDCYCAADMVVFASRTETQGLVLLEALALGVPVVSTAVMGTREVLKEGAGCLIAPEQEQAFAERVWQLLTNQGQRHQLSQSGQEWVQQNWSATVLTERLIACYSKLITQAEMINLNTAQSEQRV